MSEIDPFVHEDAAYVFGSLAEPDRQAFETHLATCQPCTARVAEARSIVGMLAGIDESALDLVDEPLPQTLLPALLRALRQERNRRRGVIATLGAVAAACAIALVVLATSPGRHDSTVPAGRGLAMAAIAPSPVRATATLTSVGWGTEIDLDCTYDVAYASGIAYSLVVVDRHNQAHVAGSWALVPGRVTHYVSGTALRREQIAKVEILAGPTPILALTV